MSLFAHVIGAATKVASAAALHSRTSCYHFRQDSADFSRPAAHSSSYHQQLQQQQQRARSRERPR
eukprot:15875-Heterococcus_DN1.PRE.1